MPAVHLEHLLRGGLLGRSAGDAAGDFKRAVAALLLDRMPLDEESLADVGKVEVVVEVGGGPDLASFDASMIRRIDLNEVGLLPILEVESKIS